ncbi:hypothetical protein LCGC14_0992910 [marine sediment metagenome]|uniref:Uncharacterized protein n=1 Tax=marine sediment metagenome TaxID=412755 RepID=A0A0F9RBP6_9ZZZZ
MDKTFEVRREDNCIWIRDMRKPGDWLTGDTVTHVVPEQAQELISALQEVLKQ